MFYYAGRGAITHLVEVHILYESLKNINLQMNIQGGPKKSLLCHLEEKCLRNSKIFFYGVFLYIYSHLLKKLELSKLCRKKSLKILKMACSKKVTLSKKRQFILFFFYFYCKMIVIPV